MILQDETTWPLEVLAFLSERRELFDDWDGPTAQARERDRKPGDHSSTHRFSGPEYDSAEYEFRDLLKPYTLSSGYHCTRLTDEEIAEIHRDGMHLPNGESLRARIRRLRSVGVLTSEIADYLSQRNQAYDKNRTGKIWFCFHPPRSAGEGGIGRFFRHWGGEALYNSHEDDAVTSPILRSIGTPALIEADVPIVSLNPNSYLTTKIVRRYFVNRGWRTEEDLDHEGYAVHALPPAAIRRIVKFPEPDFVTLTGCDAWKFRPEVLPSRSPSSPATA